MFRREAHAAWLVRALTLGLLAITLPLSARGLYGPQGALVHVRWQPFVDATERQRLEAGWQLVEGQEVSPATWRYDLTAPSEGRLRAIVEHAAVADTHYIDRQRYTLTPETLRTARRHGLITVGGIGAVGLVDRLGVLLAVLAGLCALVRHPIRVSRMANAGVARWLQRDMPEIDDWAWLRKNATIAACCVLLFHVVSVASGKVASGDGLGWDGQIYARMVDESLSEGTANTQMRPLLVLATRIPRAMGFGILESFELLNYLYAFTLYWFVALLLEQRGVGVRIRAVVAGNLALCIATSKMFAFYPAQIDLGALALICAAFYFAGADRRWPAGIACVLAAASREFGVVPSLFGLHRAFRRKRWREAFVYLPGLATTFLIRWAVALNGTDAPLSVGNAIDNLGFWVSPAFVAIFSYFAVTVFGGISVFIVAHPQTMLKRLRVEPELLTCLVVVFGLAAAGNLDIWRYLVFALPVAVVLVAEYCRGGAGAPRTLAVITVVTIVTQRPFELMQEALYFRDWFPLYLVLIRPPAPPDLAPVWTVRLISLVLIVVIVALCFRPPTGHGQEGG